MIGVHTVQLNIISLVSVRGEGQAFQHIIIEAIHAMHFDERLGRFMHKFVTLYLFNLLIFQKMTNICYFKTTSNVCC